MGQWVGGRRRWKSPLTGENHTGSALLAQDRVRAGSAREALRQSVRELTDWSRFVRTATARFGCEGLCSQEECAAICSDEGVRNSLLHCKGPWLYLSFETHWRGCCLADFPTASVVPLCDMDRRGPLPFIQRHIWAALLATLSRRFQVEPTVSNEKAALMCRDHYVWRLGQVDGVWIPEVRNASRLPQLCMRVSLQDSRSASLKWVSASGETLTVPNQNDVEVCATESIETQLEAPYGHPQWYGSRVAVGIAGARLWRKRRAEASVPFPDYDGTSTLSQISSTDDSTLSADSSSSDDEEPTVDASGVTEHEEAHEPIGPPKEASTPL